MTVEVFITLFGIVTIFSSLVFGIECWLCGCSLSFQEFIVADIIVYLIMLGFGILGACLE